MISSFWNLCRACPSMPVEKLHSEYRSTFQWHEFIGNSDSSVTQPPPVIRQPGSSQSRQDQLSTLAGGEPSFPRRKKHPDLANRSSHEWLSKSSTAYEATLCPSDSRPTNISGEGGGARGPRKSLSMGTIRPAGILAPIHSQKLSLIPQENKSSVVDDSSSAVVAGGRTTVLMATSAPIPVTIGLSGFSGADNGGGGGGGLSDFVPSHSTAAADVKIEIGKESATAATRDSSHDSKNFEDFRRKEYKSEYKKRFRPFSQYEYVDGRFFKKKGDQEIENPWYKEVIELRKKAGEYKFRGWGTELGPHNIAQVYHQHVWDQVSRRTSLAALALMSSTTPKSISKEEKDKENARKSYPGGRPLLHAPRPHTATPKHPISDFEKSKHLKESDAVQKKKLPEENRIQNKSTSRVKEQKKTSTSSSSPRPPSHKPTISALENKLLLREARSHSAGPAGRSPRKTIRQQSAASSISEKDNSSTGGWKIHLDSSQVDSSPKTQQRHPRPTTLATSRPKTSGVKGDQGDSKLAKQQFDKNSADPYMGYHEPVVKSPPEPTRVKSPEQVLKSPDPVNWTVPLDTTKSFTVTQNIREAPPQSPRFRAGEKLHGDIRNIHHPTSTHHSSAASTLASSPISTFSTRSAPLSSGTMTTAVPSSTSKSSTTTTVPTAKVSQTSSASSTMGSDKPIIPPPSSSSIESSGGGGGGGGGRSSNVHSGAGLGPGKIAGDGGSAAASASRLKQTQPPPPHSSHSSKLEQKLSQLHTTTTGHHHPHQTAVNGFEDKSSTSATAPPSKAVQKEKVGLSSSTTSKSSPHHPQPRMGVAAASRTNKDFAKISSSSTSTGAAAASHHHPATTASDKRPTTHGSSSVSTDRNKPKTVSSSGGSGGGPALKCVEDPTFMFDPPKTFSTVNVHNKSSESSQFPKVNVSSKLPEPIKPIPSKLPEQTPPKTTVSSKLSEPPPKPPLPATLSGKYQPSSSMEAPSSKSVPPSSSSSLMSSSKVAEPSKPSTAATIGGGSGSKIPEPSKFSTTTMGSGVGIRPGVESSSPLPSSTGSSYMGSSTGFKSGGSQPKSSFRVLEAPLSPPPPPTTTAAATSQQGIFNVDSNLKKKEPLFIPPAPVSAPKKTIGGVSQVSEVPPPLPSSKGSGYRVLEAPDEPDNEPTVSVISPSSGRSRASDVLEKARHRFDKFWGKSKDEEK